MKEKRKKMMLKVTSVLLAFIMITQTMILSIMSNSTTKTLNYSKKAAAASNLLEEFGVGWNLGNTLDGIWGPSMYPESDGSWLFQKNSTKAELFQKVREAGFKTVRIPVTWDYKLDDEYNISSEWLAYVKKVVDWAIDADLKVILNIHHRSKKWRTPVNDENCAGLTVTKKEWQQIANYFKNYSNDDLVFETLNEPIKINADGSGEDWVGEQQYYDGVNLWNQKLVDTIRATGGNNTTRYILVPFFSTSLNNITAVPAFEMPTDISGNTNRIIVEAHTYLQKEANHNYNIDETMNYVKTNFIDKGMPIIIDEWAYYSKGEEYDSSTRLNNIREFVQKAAQIGVPTVWWDNNKLGTCTLGSSNACAEAEYAGILDRDTYQWTDGVLENFGTGFIDGCNTYMSNNNFAGSPSSSVCVFGTASNPGGGSSGDDNTGDDTPSQNVINKSVSMTVDDNKNLDLPSELGDLSGKTVSWATSDSSIVSVDNNGKATAKKAGSATVTATVDNNVIKYNITVKARSVVDVPNTSAGAIIFYIVGIILVVFGARVIYVKKFKTTN